MTCLHTIWLGYLVQNFTVLYFWILRTILSEELQTSALHRIGIEFHQKAYEHDPSPILFQFYVRHLFLIFKSIEHHSVLYILNLFWSCFMGLESCALALWWNSIPILWKALVCSSSEMIAVNIQKYRTPYCTVHVKPVQDMCNVSCIVFLQKFYVNNSITWVRMGVVCVCECEWEKSVCLCKNGSSLCIWVRIRVVCVCLCDSLYYPICSNFIEI